MSNARRPTNNDVEAVELVIRDKDDDRPVMKLKQEDPPKRVKEQRPETPPMQVGIIGSDKKS